MIAPMKRVSIVCMKEEREKILTALQHSSLMMIEATETGVSGGDKESSEKQRRVDQLLKELDKYGKKKGLFDSLPSVSENEFDVLSDKTLSVCDTIEKIIIKRDSLSAVAHNLTSEISVLSEWAELKADVSDLNGTRSTQAVIGKLPCANYDMLCSLIDQLDASCEKVSQNDVYVYVTLVFLRDSASEVRSALSNVGFEEAQLPIKSGFVGDALADAEKSLEATNAEIAELNARLKELSESTKTDVQTLFEQYRAIAQRAEVRLDETEETVFIEGWVRADSIDRLREVVGKATDVFDLEARDPKDDEEAPTSLTNNKIVSQFEGITEMFNPPKYGDFDPNAVMAPWYWIIFGMMMGDAGYGLMMALLIFGAKKIMKPQGNTLKLMNVLLYSSLTTVIFGVLFGSYFGEELIPAVLPFTAMGDPIKMLILTLVVGVLHIFTGMITKIVINIKNGRFLDALFDQISWIMIISGLGMFFIPPLKTAGVTVAVIGAAIVLFTAGRAKAGMLGKLTGGLGGLYNVTAYFSDILSYSRILALSLATGVVGMVMNMLAGMVQGSVIGFVFSLIIYVVGHVFNLALGLLSAYVHACRLQYIEFYGKFYEGGGTMFRPFGIKTNYINIKKD